MDSDTQISFQARIGKFFDSDLVGTRRIVLEDVEVDGEHFRDHLWLKITRRIDNLKLAPGDILTGTAFLESYMNIEDLKNNKITFRHIRNLEKKKTIKTILDNIKEQEGEILTPSIK